MTFPGEVFQKLAEDVAYLKLGNVEAAKSRSYIEQAAGAKGLIIDLRNYASEFVVFTLGQHLVGERTEFARFTRGDVSNPGAFLWDAAVAITPAPPQYTGKVVIPTTSRKVRQSTPRWPFARLPARW